MNSMYGGKGAAPTGAGSMKNSTGAFKEKIPKGYNAGTIQQYDPNQLRLFEQLFSHLGPESYLSKLAGGDQSAFEEIEAPALRQFNQLQGNIASRFSGGGGGPGALSSRRSSGFQNELGQQTSNFAQQLQAQRQGLQRQAINDLFGMSSQLLGQRPYERTLTEKPKSFLESAGIQFAGGLGKGIGQAATAAVL